MNLKQMTLKKKIIVLIVLSLLVPFPTVIVPEWKIKVTAPNGIPLSNMEIIEEWSASDAFQLSKETKLTNERGIVVFPTRTFNYPLICKIPIWFINFVNFLFVHGASISGSAKIKEKESGVSIRYYNDKSLKKPLIIKQ